MGKTSWQTGEATFWSGKVAYHYRDPVAIARFLIRQRAFMDELVYAPIWDYNLKGQRVYSEMHTANWWWETQVNLLNTHCVL